MSVHRANGLIVLHDQQGLGAVGDGVEVLGPPPCPTLVERREIGRAEVAHSLGDTTGGWIEHRAMQPGDAQHGGVCGWRSGSAGEPVPHHHGVGGGVAAGVEHDPACLVGASTPTWTCTDRLGTTARRAAGSAASRQSARDGVVPLVGNAGRRCSERDWEVEEERVPVGYREVVHHRRARTGHLDARDELPLDRKPVASEVRRDRTVAEEVQSPVTGSRFGCAVIAVVRRPPKSHGPIQSSSGVISYGNPFSPRASNRPEC
jgi:hypothetical protein